MLLMAVDTWHESLVALRAVPTVLDGLLDGAGEERATARPAPDAWSAVEVAAHLADVCEQAAARTGRVRAVDGAALADFDHVGLVERRDDPSLGAARDRFGREHARLVGLLDELGPDERERTAGLQSAGPTPLPDYVWHVASEHVDHLAQLRRALDGRS